ncbi:MAG: efflux RND transporter periplasmic adaptor subunit [bacterium]|nr:efflux RND transporter periplasmic adaptor subunit [bacterium]
MRNVKQLSITLLCLFFILTAGGCKSSGGDGQDSAAGGHSHGEGDHEHENIAVTIWTSKMELFMEYPPPVRGESLDFIIHMTRLTDFKAVTKGRLTLEITPEKGEGWNVNTDELLREGIYKPTVFFSETGAYRFVIRYQGENIADVFDIGTITVVDDPHDVEETEEEAVEEISFLKEVQWKTDFATTETKTVAVKPSVKATAEVLPGPKGQVEIIAPVAGVLAVNRNKSFPSAGTYVKQGQVVAVLAPPVGTGNGWAEARLAFAQAGKEYERAKRLLKKDAISRREYETTERRYLSLKAGYPKQGGSSGSYFSIISPIEGVVTAVPALPGQEVSRGRALMTIVNSDDIRLKVNLFEKDFYRVDEPSGAALYLPGSDTPFFLTAGQMELTGKGEALDARTHTIPLLFKIDNPGKRFKVGQVLPVDIYIQREKQALCVPEQAVYDDDGRQVVFVQRGGESFEKRYIQTGTVYMGRREIISGLKEGERVVTRGAYLVKLASTSAPIGHGHTH